MSYIKLTVIIIITALLSFAATAPAAAQNSALTIEIATVKATPGDIIDIPVNITVNPGVSVIKDLRIDLGSGLNLYFPQGKNAYDTEGTAATRPYTPEKTTLGDRQGMLPVMGRPTAANISESHIVLNFLDISVPFDSTATGTLLTLKVIVGETAAGTPSITLSGGIYGNMSMDGEKTPVLVSGTVEIEQNAAPPAATQPAASPPATQPPGATPAPESPPPAETPQPPEGGTDPAGTPAPAATPETPGTPAPAATPEETPAAGTGPISTPEVPASTPETSGTPAPAATPDAIPDATAPAAIPEAPANLPDSNTGTQPQDDRTYIKLTEETSTVIPAETIRGLKEAGLPVIFELPDGTQIEIDPEDIPMTATGFDLQEYIKGTPQPPEKTPSPAPPPPAGEPAGNGTENDKPSGSINPLAIIIPVVATAGLGASIYTIKHRKR